MTGEPNRAQRRAWPKRRQWADRIATDNRLTQGAKAWLALLARRSDDQGKPVWGNQKKMGRQLGRSDRTIRSYRKEAEELGYVKTYRSKPVRGPDGRFCRRKANSYYLCLPARETAGKPAPRRKQRVPYCVVTSGKPRRRYLAENNRLSTLTGASTAATHPPGEYESGNAEHPEKPADPAVAAFFMAEMRAKLENGRLEQPQRAY